MFVHIHGYINEHGEIQNATVHADASYDSVYSRSAEKLTAIENDTALSFDIVRNAWIDANGTEYNRKAKDRTLKTGIKETITPADQDFAEAVAKVRKGIVDPKTITNNMEKIGNSVYENEQTNRIYLRNVLIHNKTVVQAGKYDPVCSARINVISKAIRMMLPIGEYRTYILDDEMMDVEADGKMTKLPRFEYVAIMGESVSSSSSSEE